MMRINVMLTEEIIEQLDKISRIEQKNRSELLREAAIYLIKEHQRLIAEKERILRIKTAISIQDTIRKKSARWNSTGELRKWRETTS